MDERILETLDDSLLRCNRDPGFLDRFYETFLASSEKVREKFRNTDFDRQKRALRASFYLMMSACEDEERGPETYLGKLAKSHGASRLQIGAELYDLWLDSLLATVRSCDPEYDQEVEEAWERVMGVGIRYLCAHYRDA